jgi:hypothetical protein
MRVSGLSKQQIEFILEQYDNGHGPREIARMYALEWSVINPGRVLYYIKINRSWEPNVAKQGRTIALARRLSSSVSSPD